MASPQIPARTLAVAFPSSVPARLTGELELKLEAALSPRATRPEKVTAVLACVFAYIGGVKATPVLVRQLATGAREWLLQRAAGLFFADGGWFESRCSGCQEIYDLSLVLDDAPRSPAGKGFPVAEVKTSIGRRKFEVPNGLHEEILARSREKDTARHLTHLCGLSKNAEREAGKFTKADITKIDKALDAITPDVASELTTDCPACGASTMAVIDPLDFAFPLSGALLRDTHILASAYGWHEEVIHQLPTARRRQYARLISNNSGSRGRSG